MKYHNFFKLITLLIITVLSTLTSFKTIATPMYTITDLGVLNGSFSTAQAINETGQVVGYAPVSSETHAFIYKNGNIVDLGNFGGWSSYAFDINDMGDIIIVNRLMDGSYHSYIHNERETFEINGINALRINNLRQVAGIAFAHATIWDSGKGKQDLGTLGGSHSEIGDINNLGQVVGAAEDTNENYHAFIWDSNAGMRDLGTLGGNISKANSINELGQVVGYSYINDLDYHAFIWDSTNGMKDLGTLPNGWACSAEAINNNGQAVGSSRTPISGTSHAILYSNGLMFDLNNLIPEEERGKQDEPGWELVYAIDINDSGQITGSGWHNGSWRAFIMTPAPEPIPEPSTILLLAIGLGSMAAIGIRKKRKP